MKCEKCGTVVTGGCSVSLCTNEGEQVGLAVEGNKEWRGNLLVGGYFNTVTGRWVPDSVPEPPDDVPYATALAFWDQRSGTRLELCGACVCEALRRALGIQPRNLDEPPEPDVRVGGTP